MFSFIAHRLLTSVLVLLLVSVVVFVSIRLSPGDPALLMLGADSADLVVGNAPGSDYEKSAFEARLQVLRHEMGLDQPLYVQYLFWLQGILKGNLGYSVRNQLPVLPLILDRLPASLELLVFATVLATLIALPAGIWSAVRHRTMQDYVTTTLAASGMAIPIFWLGLLLIQVFSVNLGWLPPSGYVPLWENPIENLRRAILPSLTLGVYLAAIFVRFLRADMLEVLQQDYIRTAYAKGLNRRQVIFNHALKNALISLLTVMGVAVGGLLSGAVLIEQVFGWSGLGWLVVQAIFNRDYPIVQGVVLLSALGFTLINVLVDISYGLLNPRIRV